MARSVGIEKEAAHKIAYASQYVDDAKINHITLDNNNKEDLLKKFDEDQLIKNAPTVIITLKLIHLIMEQ